MKTLLSQLSRLYRQVRGLFPSALPNGMTEFDTWANSIINTYTMPTLDEASIKFGLTTTIMRLGPTEAYKSKYFFVLILKAGASKQIAGAVFEGIKNKQKQAEATAKAAEASNAQTPQL